MRETVRRRGMTLLPPAPDKCQLCATDHPADQAHNAQSLFYQTRFQMQHGRSGTWADAIAHLPAQLQAFWRGELEAHNAWTEPPAGVEPIAETEVAVVPIDAPGGPIQSAAELAAKLRKGNDARES